MIVATPTRYFMACGSAEGVTELNAFDAALLRAGVGDTNLVRVSSILPPGCEEVELPPLPPGALVPAAYASVTSATPGEVITAAVAVAIPEDEDPPRPHHGASRRRPPRAGGRGGPAHGGGGHVASRREHPGDQERRRRARRHGYRRRLRGSHPLELTRAPFMPESPPGKPATWFTEYHGPGTGLTMKVLRTLYSAKSAFQEITLVETEDFGRVLLLDGIIQTTERDEFVYHEMLAHVPMCAHAGPGRVLVIGGGDGGCVREALRHETVEQVTLVEIDRMVVDCCREFLPGIAGGLDDPRVEVRIEDGVKFIEGQEEAFDVILVDSTDPVAMANPLTQVSFFRKAKRALETRRALRRAKPRPRVRGSPDAAHHEAHPAGVPGRCDIPRERADLSGGDMVVRAGAQIEENGRPREAESAAAGVRRHTTTPPRSMRPPSRTPPTWRRFLSDGRGGPPAFSLRREPFRACARRSPGLPLR